MNELEELKNRLREFTRVRDWEKFHSPKNLSMALIAEAAELIEHFQWLSEQQSSQMPAEKLVAVEHEVADIFIYLVRIADKLGIDLIAAAHRKMAINEEKYPASKVRGDARKYFEYKDTQK